MANLLIAITQQQHCCTTVLSGISLTSHVDSFFFPLERRHLISEVCNARKVHTNRQRGIKQTKISRSREVGFLLADCPAVSFRFV